MRSFTFLVVLALGFFESFSTSILVLLVRKFPRYGSLHARNLKLLNEISGMLTSLSWLDETLYAYVRKPFRCSESFKVGFASNKNFE